MKIKNKKRWILPPGNSETLNLISKEAGVSRVVARLLLNRGIDSSSKAKRFLEHSLEQCYNPFLMKGMIRAVEKLREAIFEKRKILIFGDFDVDGLTGTALLYKVFSEICHECIFTHIPNRMKEGYGLNEEIFDFAKQNGIDVIVTVDCGISSKDEAELAKKMGIDLLITDHHHPPEQLPDAYAIVNPKQPGCPYPFKDLSGVGIAMKLLHGIFSWEESSSKSLYLPLPKELWEHLDLVALGTIADIMPLLDENRIFVRYGLDVLTSTRKLGLQSLKRVSGLDCKTISSFDVGFKLAPRINAAGRVGNAESGLKLLITESAIEAENLALELQQENKNRKTIEDQILAEAREMCKKEDFSEKHIIVLSSDKWHPGVIGIVASRLVDEFFLPVIMIALNDGVGRGSGRSIDNFHLYDHICECEDLLLNFGGHEHAAGLSIEEKNIPLFKEKIEDLSVKKLSEGDFQKTIDIDGELLIDNLSLEHVESINEMAPFGEGNREPVFFSRNLNVIKYPSIVGNNHLRMRVKDKFEMVNVIGFNMGEYKKTLVSSDRTVDIVFTPQVNNWQGKRTLQLKMIDIRTSE